jgi:endonuclease YncB( thermonuclease family)
MQLIPTFRRVSFIALFLLARLLFADFSGVVAAVQDGDTMSVLYQERAVRVRLSGIDCPEKTQPFGWEALRFTTDLALGNTVTVIEEDIDRYGRIVGSVILPDGRNLNHAIVAAGLAWWYRRYAPNDAPVQTLEFEARRGGHGLWADAVPVPPWEWRKENYVPARSDRHRSEPRSQNRDRGRSRR